MSKILSRKFEPDVTEYLDHIPHPTFIHRIDLSNFPSPDALASPSELGTPTVSSSAPEPKLAPTVDWVPIAAGLGALAGVLIGLAIGQRR